MRYKPEGPNTPAWKYGVTPLMSGSSGICRVRLKTPEPEVAACASVPMVPGSMSSVPYGGSAIDAGPKANARRTGEKGSAATSRRKSDPSVEAR